MTNPAARQESVKSDWRLLPSITSMAYVTLDSSQIYYDWRGSGPDVTLLHHATASSRNWRQIVPALAEQYTTLVYDRPGFGRSSWLADWPLDYLDRDVDGLIALLDALSIDQTALLGHSDGAAIALLAAARHPQRVSCVIAEAPHVAVETPRCPDAVRSLADEAERSPQLQAALARDHGDHGLAVVRRWARRWLDPAFWSWDVSDELAGVCCPVLVVHGADDPFFSLAHSAMIADRVANGQLHVVADAAHGPHNQARQQFSELALSFLAGVVR